MPEHRRRIWPWITLAVVVVLGVVVVTAVLPQVQKLLKLKEDVVRFQKAAQVGPGAFTPPADIRAKVAAASAAGGAGGASGADGQSPAAGGAGGTPPPATGGAEAPKPGTFGGSGSDRVCDREKLIKHLRASPERLRAWAETVGIEATPQAVAAFIRKLRPVTLTKDTQVTNHSFKNGAAKPYQAIMQKGTAVLVDKDGKPVARCRCGNPLTEPVKLAEKPKCIDCPRNYKPPAPCDYHNYDDQKFEEGSGDREFASEYQSGEYRDTCYRPAPEAPPTKGEEEPPPEETDCQTNPESSECQERCETDPSLPFCDGTTPEGQTEEELPSEGESTIPEGDSTSPDGDGTSGGSEAPSDGSTGGSAPDSSGGSASP